MNSKDYLELAAKPVIEQMFDMLDDARNQVLSIIDMAKAGTLTISEEILDELSSFIARTEKYVAPEN